MFIDGDILASLRFRIDAWNFDASAGSSDQAQAQRELLLMLSSHLVAAGKPQLLEHLQALTCSSVEEIDELLQQHLGGVEDFEALQNRVRQHLGSLSGLERCAFWEGVCARIEACASSGNVLVLGQPVDFSAPTLPMSKKALARVVWWTSTHWRDIDEKRL